MAHASQVLQGEERRREILEWVRHFIDDNGYSPSMEEIGVGIGVHKNAVNHHLKKLQKEGKVSMTPGKYRSLRLIEGDSDVREVSDR